MAFLGQTVGRRAHLVGASDGGIVGLLVAMQRPDLLRRLVTIGSSFHRDGLVGASMWTEASRMTRPGPCFVSGTRRSLRTEGITSR